MGTPRRSLEVSHGRGGAGNITPDTQEYVDADIVRQGDPRASGGAYSTGRGGAYNIASPKQKPVATENDIDVVPEQSKVRTPLEGFISTGRGGEGNIGHKGDVDRQHDHHQTLEDKLKNMLHHKKPKSKEEAVVSQEDHI